MTDLQRADSDQAQGVVLTHCRISAAELDFIHKQWPSCQKRFNPDHTDPFKWIAVFPSDFPPVPLRIRPLRWWLSESAKLLAIVGAGLLIWAVSP